MFLFTPNKRVHLIFSGKIQGIGFRQSVILTARSLKLTGWVRNLDTGGVELLAEGKPKNIIKLIEKIDKSYVDFIEAVEIEWSAATGEFRSFEVLQNVIVRDL